MVSLGGVQKVLQNLLRDGVPIKDMLSIIETIADHAPSTKDTDLITEHVRKALARTITKQLTGDGDQLPENLLHTAKGEVSGNKLLSRQDVQTILDSLAQHHPKVVEELVPANLSLGGVQKVLQNLLRDGVPIKDMLSIIETIADHAPSTKDTDLITEHVRKALARTITKQLTGDGDQLPVMIVDPRVEDAIRKSFNQPEGGQATALQPLFTQKFMERVAEGVQEVVAQGYHPILMTSPDMRSIMSKMMRQALPTITVIATNEVAGEVKIKNVKVVSVDDAYEKV